MKTIVVFACLIGKFKTCYYHWTTKWSNCT